MRAAAFLPDVSEALDKGGWRAYRLEPSPSVLTGITNPHRGRPAPSR